MRDLPQILRRLSPITRLNSFLQSHLDSMHPERTEHISVAEDGSYAADVVLTLRTADTDAPEVHTGFGYSMSEPTQALQLAKMAASLSLLHRLLVLLKPSEFSGKALFLPRRPAGNAVLTAVPGPIADGTPQLGTSKRWAQWTNGASAMLAHLPREVPLGHSFADFQLHSGRTLELQRTSDISIGTIERRRRDHAAHSAGDPVWWLDAAGMFKGDYFVIARAAGDLVLIQPTCSRATLDCIGALGPDVIFDLAYRNTVLVAAGPLVRTPEPMMWMRLVPLLPILHRLGAIQHFSRAYGGAPSFAERPDTITYIELTTSDWTTEPPTRTPVYSPDMPVPPPPDTAPTDEVERILVADMPPHDRQRYGRVGSDVVRRVSPSCTMCATVENYLPATMNTGAHFTLRYADGGRERISPAALDVSPEPDAYTLHLAVRRPTQLRCTSIPLLPVPIAVSALPSSHVRRPSATSVLHRSTRRASLLPLLVRPLHPLRRTDTTGSALSA